MPLAFGLPSIFPTFGDSFTHSYPDFFSLIFNPTLFGFAIFGAMVLAPERFFQGGANAVTNYSGQEFILTRAIDRPVSYRAKAALLFLLVLSVPVLPLLRALPHPDVVIREYSQPTQQAALAAIPGSRLLVPDEKKAKPKLLAIPRGNILAAEWRILLPVMLVILLQIAIAVLYPLKQGRWIFWGLYVVSTFSPFLAISYPGREGPTMNEAAFFAFTSHQAAFLCLTALAFIVTQLWCERRFARMEF